MVITRFRTRLIREHSRLKRDGYPEWCRYKRCYCLYRNSRWFFIYAYWRCALINQCKRNANKPCLSMQFGQAVALQCILNKMARTSPSSLTTPYISLRCFCLCHSHKQDSYYASNWRHRSSAGISRCPLLHRVSDKSESWDVRRRLLLVERTQRLLRVVFIRQWGQAKESDKLLVWSRWRKMGSQNTVDSQWNQYHGRVEKIQRQKCQRSKKNEISQQFASSLLVIHFPFQKSGIWKIHHQSYERKGCWVSLVL